MTLAARLRGQLGSEQTNRGPSRGIWGRAPVLSVLEGTIDGYYWFDDFLDYVSTATTVRNRSGVPVFEGDCTVTGGALTGGVLQLFGTTDNEEAALQVGGGASAPFVIPADSADGHTLWFECRVKKSIITADKAGFYVGFASQGAGVADFIADAGNDFADVDLLGFWNLEGEANIDAICQKTSAAFDTVIDEMEVLEADTWTKLGLIYDPKADDEKKITFFVNGIPQTTYVGEDSGDATVYLGDTTNFPGGEEMSLLIAMKMAAADDVTVSLDWWRCLQLA